jgi:glycosyltransferase involved in cell wall biosynthesis
MYRKADHLIFTMQGGLDYCKRYDIDPEKISYVNNGINLKEYDKFKKELIYIEFEISNDSFNVFYTGTISHYNGVEYLIKAAKIIDEKNLKIKFYVVGDGLLLEKIKNITQEYNLNNIEFTGHIDKRYIPSILEKSDLNLLLGIKIDLNKYGLSPNKLFDYFASGKPVISNRMTKYDIVSDENAGITVLDESAEELAKGIIHFYDMKINNYDKYQMICNNSRNAAYKYDFKVLANKLEDILERI